MSNNIDKANVGKTLNEYLDNSQTHLKSKILSRSLDMINKRRRELWTHESQERGNIFLGWMIVLGMLIVYVGILVEYIHLCVVWPRTHGWKVLTLIMGVDVDNQTKNCEIHTWSVVTETKVYKRCSTEIYFGIRSFGSLVFQGAQTIVLVSSILFHVSSVHRCSLKFRRLVDNVMFLCGLVTSCNVCMVIYNFISGRAGIMTDMLGDMTNLPDPFISQYWEQNQLKGQCCGIWGTVKEWKVASRNQSFPISCCNINAYDCSDNFVNENQGWVQGCYELENYFMMKFGTLCTFGVTLQLVLIILFEFNQSNFHQGARTTILPNWVHVLIGRQRVAPANTNQNRLSQRAHCTEYSKTYKPRIPTANNWPNRYSRIEIKNDDYIISHGDTGNALSRSRFS